MNNLYALFNKSVIWNTVESVIYEAVLISHHIAMFAILGKAQYGFIGTLFSLIYLFAKVSNIGLDQSLPAFFTHFSKNKKNCSSYLITQLVLQIIGLTIFSVALFFLGSYVSNYYPILKNNSLMLNITCVGLACIESIKRPIRKILQLQFKNHITATLEILIITLYIATVWVLYWCGFELTPTLVLLPKLICTAIALLIMSYYIINWVRQLPTDSSSEQPILKRIISNRLFNFCNQLTSNMFSSNVLVPLTAGSLGLESAGILKICSNAAYTVTGLIHTIFGQTGDALLAHTKDAHLIHAKKAFKHIATRINQVLYAVVIISIINYKKLALLLSASQAIPALTLYLLFILIISENLFIAYERFFITHERTDFFMIFNLCALGVLFYTLPYAQSVSPTAALLAIIVIRAVMFTLISLYSYRTWNISPGITPQPAYITSLVAISLLILFILP